MGKEFNITGRCYASEHYIVNTHAKLDKILTLVSKKQYFTINRPRQYGKTTMLFNIAQRLRSEGGYFVINTSFEGMGDSFFENEKNFANVFLKLLQEQTTLYGEESLLLLFETSNKVVETFKDLSAFITEFVKKIAQKVVLLIDEVDQSGSHQIFISFLAMLRNKYLAREEMPTFHSVILAGVHDVKNLKWKIRPDSSSVSYNSPWNIATEFKVDMNFYPEEIKPMLESYANDKALSLDSQMIAEDIFYYTSGYPFLVSKICKIFDEDLLPEKHEKTWTTSDTKQAVKLLVREKNTNFETLIKNLENNEELYDLIYQIGIDGVTYSFNRNFPLIDMCALYGILREEKGRAVIHNRIYNEVIMNYMSDKMHFLQSRRNTDFNNTYRNDDNSLNMENVLLGFQAFMRKEYAQKDHDFVEKNGRLIFLAFLKPIINGSGYDFKEPQISEERRLDLVITYYEYKYIAELKIWRGDKAHEKGLLQLADYLTTQGVSEGYLLVFNKNIKKTWNSEWVDFQGKKIFVVWL
jgi:hypothetical protein